MIRTQVYLQDEQQRDIELLAKHERKPQAQVIREALAIGLAKKKPTHNGGDALLALARLGEEMGITSDDPNISRNIDTYLYEKP